MIQRKIAFIIGFIVFLGSRFFSYSYFSPEGAGGTKTTYKAPTAGSTANLEEGPKTEECPMNGRMMTEAQRKRWEARRPMGVMIENHTEARPQSGLSDADIVYEAVAEGGITRFLNIFYCDEAEIMGPVRSARIYYVTLLQEYGKNPLYVHVGGANTPGPADALGEIGDLGWDGYNDMNQFAVPFPYYYRDYERLGNVATEHTMYASAPKLWDYAAKQRKLSEVDEDGQKWDEGFTPWIFKDDAASGGRGNVSKISFGFWTQFANDYGVVWDYDKATNSYKRNNGGEPHIDKNTGKALSAKNVFVIFSDESAANDGYPGGHMLYELTGRGDGIFFQDGKATEGTWRKADEESRMKFYDTAGKEIAIVRGPVWIEILPTGNEVEY